VAQGDQDEEGDIDAEISEEQEKKPLPMLLWMIDT